MAKLTIALLALLASSMAMGQECGKPAAAMRANRQYDPDGQRIVGGVEARPGSHPWIVSLQQYGSHFCGGSLVPIAGKNETDIVVTAAHCVYDGTSRLTASAGAHDLDRPSPTQQTVNGIKTVYHPSYNPRTTANDIAIVVLDKPIKFTDNVKPACLPNRGDVVPDNAEATVAGWGVTRENGMSSQKLLQVGVPTINNKECKTMYAKARIDIDPYVMLCAGYKTGGKDACQGDSGGPFVMPNGDGTYTLRGVVSFGVGCARAGMPGVYTNVAEFTSWIQTQITINSKVKYSS